MAGTFTAITATTNKIAWQQQMPYRMGGGGGSTVTAGGLLLRGEPDGNFVALNAKTGEVLFKFQTGFGADAPPVVYEVDGQQYITIVTGGNWIQGSATGDAVWTFALNGNVQPLYPPPPPATVAGPLGPIAEGVDRVRIADNNVEYSYWPARMRVKRGAQMTFTNDGDIPHTATATAAMAGKWDTGLFAKGEFEDHHLQRGGHLLLHLHAAPVDVRSGHRRAISWSVRHSPSGDYIPDAPPCGNSAWWRFGGQCRCG